MFIETETAKIHDNNQIRAKWIRRSILSVVPMVFWLSEFWITKNVNRYLMKICSRMWTTNGIYGIGTGDRYFHRNHGCPSRQQHVQLYLTGRQTNESKAAVNIFLCAPALYLVTDSELFARAPWEIFWGKNNRQRITHEMNAINDVTTNLLSCPFNRIASGTVFSRTGQRSVSKFHHSNKMWGVNVSTKAKQHHNIYLVSFRFRKNQLV